MGSFDNLESQGDPFSKSEKEQRIVKTRCEVSISLMTNRARYLRGEQDVFIMVGTLINGLDINIYMCVCIFFLSLLVRSAIIS